MLKKVKLRAVPLIAALAFALVGSMALEAQELLVRPGDQVEIDFFTASGVPLIHVSGIRLVDRTGHLHLPYVGEVQVIDLDAEGIREVLETEFSAFYDSPVIDVSIKVRVNVTGSVMTNGHFLLSPSMTIIDAIANAAGFIVQASGTGGLGGNSADASRVRLIRAGEIQILNLSPSSPNPEHVDMLIQSGDWIHVPPQVTSRFRDNVQFFGSLASITTTVVGLLVILAR